MRHRTWPVLLLGLGTLLLLVAVFGFTAIHKTSAIYAEMVSSHERYRHNDAALEDIRSGLFLASLLVRDFLLDSSPANSEEYREHIRRIHETMDRQIGDLEKLTREEDKAALRTLQTEVRDYWRTIEPIFAWTPEEKVQKRWGFLRAELRGRRGTIFDIANEVVKLNQGNVARQEEAAQASKRDLDSDLRRLLIACLFIGALVLAGSTVRVSQLERRTVEQHKRAQQAEQAMRDLSHQLVRAQEEERRRLSRELHDETGQLLTALRMELANLEQLRTQDGDAFAERMLEAKQLAERSLQSVRGMAMGLRPSMLDDLGLGPAVEWQARDFSKRFGVPVTVQIDGRIEDLPDTHRTSVYRVVQEALTNCARHARAKNIRVALHGGPDRLSLTVQDDGVGWPAEDPPRGGVGLLGMEERVRDLGGTLEIQSQPGRGTLLRADIPAAEGNRA
ncbi:MAG: MCP four helix bundle domain-containing protein [Acidobacteria bacterium]|nr:MCP four helix bundle domain-containing protein [Acidobacteriota bacterium]